MSNASLSNQDRSGPLGEIRVQDVFLQLEQAAQDARAWFETEYGMGEVLFCHGRMVRARLGGARGQTALLRLLAVTDGRYGVETCTVAAGPALIGSVSQLIELHSTRKAEWNELCASAPALSSVLRLTASGATVRDSSRGIQRVMLVLIDGRRTLMQVLEESSFDPVEALRVVNQAVADNLVQAAQQGSSLFPLSTSGDASGVLPRFAQVPVVSESSVPDLTSGPPSWRHATLVGLGKTPASSGRNVLDASGFAPSPIIDLGRGPQLAHEAGMLGGEPGSLVKTIVEGHGRSGKRSSSDPVLVEPTISHDSLSRDVSADGTGRSEVGRNPKVRQASQFERRIIDVAASVADPHDSQPPEGPLSASFPAGSVLPKPDGQRRYVDRYEIILRIGRGGMGTVYLARLSSANVGFRRLFALKLLRSHLSTDTQAAKDFVDEARVAGQLHHANVVAVYDAGFHGKQPYLVMDYVEGCSFKQLMRGLPSQSPFLILPIVIDALAGLHAAHTLQDESGADLKLVHCDVSPENMLVGVDGTCRLTDFGIARKASPLMGNTTRGKPGFVAPEQITGSTFDHRADIFSMGVVLWGALTGQRLFAGDTVEETVSQVCHKPIQPPSACGAQSYGALDEIVMRALSRNPEGRFGSAEEMLTALSQVAVSHDGLATPKEIAAWVREAAGTELSQRRLSILDASRNIATIPPGAVTSEDVIPRNPSEGYDATHTVLKRELLAGEAEAAQASGGSEDEGKPDSAAAGNRPLHSEPGDVAALFYGPEGVIAGQPSAVTAADIPLATDSTPSPTRSGRRRWLLWVAIAIVGAGLAYIFVRPKSSDHNSTPNQMISAPAAQVTSP